MKKQLITLCAIFCSFVTTTFADSFSISDFVSAPNSTVEITIYTNLDAAAKNKALSIDVILPEGYSIATIYDEDLEEDVPDVTILATSMMPGFSIKTDGSLRIGCAGCTIGKGKKAFASFRMKVNTDAKNSLFTTEATRIAGNAVESITFKSNVLTDITLDDYGYASYSVCAPVEVTGATVKGGTVNGDVLSLTGNGTTVPANTGVMLVGEPNATVTLAAAESADPISSALTPAVLDTEVAASSVIVYAKNAGEFRTFSGTVIPANKAYLQDAPAGIRIRIDDVNGINSINADKNVAFRYNLMGVQTSNEKGITIENGKKVLK